MMNLCLPLLLSIIVVVFSTDIIELDDGHIINYSLTDSSSELMYHFVSNDPLAVISAALTSDTGPSQLLVCSQSDPEACKTSPVGLINAGGTAQWLPGNIGWFQGDRWFLLRGASGTSGKFYVQSSIRLTDSVTFSEDQDLGTAWESDWRYFAFMPVDSLNGVSFELEGQGTMYVSKSWGHPDETHCDVGHGMTVDVPSGSVIPGVYYFVGVSKDSTAQVKLTAIQQTMDPLMPEQFTSQGLCGFTDCYWHRTINISMLTQDRDEHLTIGSYSTHPELAGEVEIMVGWYAPPTYYSHDLIERDGMMEMAWTDVPEDVEVFYVSSRSGHQNYLIDTYTQYNTMFLISQQLTLFKDIPSAKSFRTSWDADASLATSYDFSVNFYDSPEAPDCITGDLLEENYFAFAQYIVFTGYASMVMDLDTIPGNTGRWAGSHLDAPVSDQLIIQPTDDEYRPEGTYMGSLTPKYQADPTKSISSMGNVIVAPMYTVSTDAISFEAVSRKTLYLRHKAQQDGLQLILRRFDGQTLEAEIYADKEVYAPHEQTGATWTGVSVSADQYQVNCDSVTAGDWVYIAVSCDQEGTSLELTAGAPGFDVDEILEGATNAIRVQSGDPQQLRLELISAHSNVGVEEAFVAVTITNSQIGDFYDVTLSVHDSYDSAFPYKKYTFSSFRTRGTLMLDIPSDRDLFITVEHTSAGWVEMDLISAVCDSSFSHTNYVVPRTGSPMWYRTALSSQGGVALGLEEPFYGEVDLSGLTVVFCPDYPPTSEVPRDECVAWTPPDTGDEDDYKFITTLGPDNDKWRPGYWWIGVFPVNVDPGTMVWVDPRMSILGDLDQDTPLRVGDQPVTYLLTVPAHASSVDFYAEQDGLKFGGICITVDTPVLYWNGWRYCDAHSTAGPVTLHLSPSQTDRQVYVQLFQAVQEGDATLTVSDYIKAVQGSATTVTMSPPDHSTAGGESAALFHVYLSSYEPADSYVITVDPGASASTRSPTVRSMVSSDRWPSYANAADSSELPGVQMLRISSDQLGGIFEFYVRLDASDGMTTTTDMTITVQAEDAADISSLTFMTPLFARNGAVGATFRHYFDVEDAGVSFLLSPCRGSLSMYADTRPEVSATSYRWRSRGLHGEEMILTVDDTMPLGEYFLALTSDAPAFSYELMPVGADPRPWVPHPELSVTVKGSKLEVTAQPGEFSGQLGDGDLEYMVYVSQSGFSTYSVLSTACGVEYFADTGLSEWRRGDDGLTFLVKGLTKHTEYWINLEVRKANDPTSRSVYTGLYVTTKGTDVNLVIGIVMIVLGVLVAGWVIYLWVKRRPGSSGLYQNLSE